MNELNRLSELEAYNIMDTLPEDEFDEIVELASTICDVPISLISLIDSNRQWFKAKVGLEAASTPREHAFCAHAIQNPNDIMVVEDSTKDDRFKDNPLVTSNPNVRFYAGAPLLTKSGQALGTLCLIDKQPRKMEDWQRRALMLLSKKVMKRLEYRKQLLEQEKEIKSSAHLLKELTDRAPGALYQFEIDADDNMHFSFISKGIEQLIPSATAEELISNPTLLKALVHADDMETIVEQIQVSKNKMSLFDVSYRVNMTDGSLRWHRSTSKPMKREDGTIVWYGTFQDITEDKEYIRSLEEISFSISHVIRRPVSTLLGLVEAIKQDDITPKGLLEYAGYFQKVTEELDEFIKVLADTYAEKIKTFKAKI